ncbi:MULTISPECIES: hypothetical protein [Burkholderia]|uniref:hypothetical protein n=1 Tax=Burkholderia TaxID=32008 RepID=UPI0005541F2D|nr:MULTISPECIES: hypothetical protein [Burkholderia]TCT31272.1 hypothetical protein EC918_103170 [Burkholderia vietnamiensis]SCZ21045.1 hypothetical protein SAMN02787148_102175 [Burkholderia vietnamiensis]SFX14004.1 hypothetical protein SAMN02787160_102169 [Burkholderia vietnamiensis]
MAIDVDALPPRIESYPQPPSLLVWSIIFVACTVGGGTAALLVWPKRFPTATPVFWIAIVIVPLLVAAIVTLVPFLRHAGKVRAITSWNDRRDRYVAGVFDEESRPIAVLGSFCRFPVHDARSPVSKVASGEIVLVPQQTPDKTATVAARWFAAPEFSIETEPREYDADRQRVLLLDLLSGILDALEPRIGALPAALPLKVALFIDAPSFDDDIRQHFRSFWNARALRAFTFDAEQSIPGLMSLDRWLDRQADSNPDYAMLLVTIQLHDLVTQSPPPGSGEAAIALLMARHDVGERPRLGASAYLHRPRQGTLASLQQALSLALKWGKAKPADIQHLWHTGFDKVGQQALMAAARTEKVALVESQQVPGEHNVDRIVGDAGIAADWFALACAVEFAQSFGGPQLVARHNEANSIVSVVRPAVPSSLEPSL